MLTHYKIKNIKVPLPLNVTANGQEPHSYMAGFHTHAYPRQL